MPDAREHGAIVLAGIIPGQRERLTRAIRLLQGKHFIEAQQGDLFDLLNRYYDRTGGVLSQSALEDLTRRRDSGRAALMLETYLTYVEQSVGDEQFEWSIDQLRELSSERETAEALTSAMEVLRTGKEVDGEEVRGAEEARAYLTTAISQIDREMTMQEAPEGDVRTEQADILADYQNRKQIAESGASRGVLFGVDALDSRIGGLSNGEVVLVAGYSSDGKTTLVTQLAWSAAIEQGKNVVFFTTETLREQVRRKILARHSMHPRFDLHGTHGINSYDIKNGTIPPSMETRFEEIVRDFTTNPDYGTLYIKQVPRGASLSFIEQSLASLYRKFPIDLVVVDYLALFTSERRRQSTREELAAIMKDSKQIATSVFGGRGVPIVSPWQVSRAAREKAEDVGRYTSASLSETAEATNTADIIIGLLAPIDNSERIAQTTFQIMKNRDGPTVNDLRVQVDYGTSWFRSSAGGIAASTAVHASAGTTSSLEDIIG